MIVIKNEKRQYNINREAAKTLEPYHQEKIINANIL